MPTKEREYKTHEDSKLIPPGTELVPFHVSGQPVSYFLRFIDSKLCYSSLPRNESGKVLTGRKELRRMKYGNI